MWQKWEAGGNPQIARLENELCHQVRYINSTNTARKCKTMTSHGKLKRGELPVKEPIALLRRRVASCAQTVGLRLHPQNTLVYRLTRKRRPIRPYGKKRTTMMAVIRPLARFRCGLAPNQGVSLLRIDHNNEVLVANGRLRGKQVGVSPVCL